MLVRTVGPEELETSARLFAVAFEAPFDPKDLTPFAENPVIWAAFDEAGGEMMSTVYVTDFDIRFDTGTCRMGGVGGVATLPQYRRAGGVRACFQAALTAMYREGYVFSYLYPFSTAYYRKFGYESGVQDFRTVVDLSLLKVPEQGGYYRLAGYGESLYPAVRALDAQWEREYNMMVQHTERDYVWLKKADPAVRQEFTYVYFDAENTPKGYTTFKKCDEEDGRNLVCSRFCFADREGYAGLLGLFARFASDHRYVKFKIPACTAMQYRMPEWSLGAARWELQRKGMVRVVNVEAALKMAKYRGSGTVTLRIRDEQLPENDGIFRVVFENSLAQSVEQAEDAADAELSIQTFSALLCGVSDFEDAARWMDGVRVRNESAPLERVFYKKPMMIVDYF